MNNIIYIPGIWDILHPGHINILERAKGLGGTLVVGVPTDEIVEEDKGHKPILSLEHRMNVLKAIKYVDLIIPYDKLEFLTALRRLDADILVIGEDWGKEKRHVEAVEYMKSKGGKVIQFPYTQIISSTEIKSKVVASMDKENRWKEIWEQVGQSKLDDVQVVGGYSTYGENGAKKLAEYFIRKLSIQATDKVLDLGCGSGIMLKHINCIKFGIDISHSMIERAVRNNPGGIFLMDSKISFKGGFDHIICYGVFQYFPSYVYAKYIVNQMKSLSDSILICEIPDIERAVQREEHRRLTSKHVQPRHLYYNKSFFEGLDFTVFDNEISVTNNSDYGFTAKYG